MEIAIIHEMCKTLNVSGFSELSKETKEFILKVIETFKDSIKYKALSTLIHNYNKYGKAPLLYNFYSPSGIMLGPGALRRLTSEKFDKVIYLFGEYHIPYNAHGELRVSDFLDKLFRNTPVPIDFYLEHTGEFSNHPGKGNFKDISDIRCMSSYYNRICPNVRVHNIDLRNYSSFPINLNTIVVYYDTFMADANMENKDFKNLSRILSTKSFFRRDYKKKLKSSQEYFYSQLNTLPPCLHDVIKYSFNIISNFDTPNYISLFPLKDPRVIYFEHVFPNLKTFSKLSIHDQILQTLDIVTKHASNMKTQKDINALYYILFLLLEFILNYTYLFMDGYAISRMFIPRSDEPYKNNIEPRNIIFYGGRSHLLNITEMLQWCGFTEEVFDDPLDGPHGEYPKKLDLKKLGQFFPFRT